MKLSNIDSARMMRDAGIDAMAALDSAIRDTIDGLPANEQKAIKHAFGKAMASVMVELINPATAAFPELEPDARDRVAAAKRVSNPGCYPTGFLALVRPLVRAGLLPADRIARAHCRSIAGEMHSGFANLRSALPMNLKEVLVLRTIEGLSQAETAEVLGVSQKAIETRLYRARARLIASRQSRRLPAMRRRPTGTSSRRGSPRRSVTVATARQA